MMSLRPRFTLVLALALASIGAGVFVRPALATGGIGDLFVTSDASNLVRAYTGTTGAALGVFTSSTLGLGQMAIHFGATNNRVLVGHSSGGVDEYDATTGGYIKTYNPGGGWQWAGIYRSDGRVLIGSMATNDIRVYNPTTGALIYILCPFPGPADMEFGPNGNLYVCSYTTSQVMEIDPIVGTVYNVIPQTFGDRTNDVAFLPSGNMLVTAMSSNVCYVYDPAYTPITSFAGTGWLRPHGVAISPHTGNILVADGVTTQVHEFDPITYAELNPAFLVPGPGDKIVDIAFRPDAPTKVESSSTWGRIKELYRK